MSVIQVKDSNQCFELNPYFKYNTETPMRHIMNSHIRTTNKEKNNNFIFLFSYYNVIIYTSDRDMQTREMPIYLFLILCLQNAKDLKAFVKTQDPKKTQELKMEKKSQTANEL